MSPKDYLQNGAVCIAISVVIYEEKKSEIPDFYRN